MTNSLVYNLAFKALSFIALVPVWLFLCLLFRPDYSSVTLRSFLLALPACNPGFCHHISCWGPPSPAWRSGPRGCMRSASFILAW